MSFIFKQFRSEGGCVSFILGDPHSKKACLIDPRADETDNYEAFLAKRGLVPALTIDTHTHADHYSGTHWVAEKFNSPIAMGEKTQSKRSTLALKDGQAIDITDRLGLKVISTPGHTPDSLSLVWQEPWGAALFTGDTLFIGGSGRTDFPGASPADHYESLYKKLGTLAGATWVLPSHDYSDLLFSTLDEERKTNPHLLFKDREAFIAMKTTEALESSGVIPKIVEFNMTKTPVTKPRSGAHTMCASSCVKTSFALSRKNAQQFEELLGDPSTVKDSLFLDIREPEEREQGYIEGTRNIPMSELLMHWNELKSAKAVYLSCQRGNRTQVAAQSLMRLGLVNIFDLDGGYLAWRALKKNG